MVNEPRHIRNEVFLEIFDPDGEVVYSNKTPEALLRDVRRKVEEAQQVVRDMEPQAPSHGVVRRSDDCSPGAPDGEVLL